MRTILSSKVIFAVLPIVVMLSGCGAGDGSRLQAAFDAEFLARPDGYPGLKEHYDFEFPTAPMQMDPGLMYRACAQGAVDVICGFATDGRIPAYGLKTLEDDKGFFPPYYAAPLVRQDTLKEFSQLREILNQLGGTMTNKEMRQMNYEVDENRRTAADVAREFLVKKELLEKGAEPGSGNAGTVVVGSKAFTEQEIIGEIMVQLIECSSDIAVDRKLSLGGTMVCFTALKAGDLDLYAEYTGTGLVNILDREVIPDSQKAYDTVQKAFQKKYDMTWLEPFGFNNTYTLTMRKEQAEKLGIETISDVAEVLSGTEGG
ncbi:MAG: glycine betaine ABC transporter substrate-binding protein [Candidatus Hydrogenedentota bacterium]